MKRKWCWHHPVLAVLVALLLWTTGSIYAIASYANKSETRPADAAIVLGAAVFGDQPSPVFRERIKHAVWLYRQGYVSKLILTGGQSPEDALAESEAAEQYAIAQGVNQADILTESQSRTTEQNLFYAHELARKFSLDTVLIVSDPLHMKRAVAIARDLGLDAYSSPTPTSRYTSWKTRFEFLLRETYFYQQYQIRRLLRWTPA
ncbi:MAG: YdcF family protein [Anaerolineae bacterium]|nr:YdcF family protein [Anaerolineae bacterium]